MPQRIRVVEVRDRARWDAAVLAAPGADLLQSWGWGAFRERVGRWRALRLAVMRGEEARAGAQVLARPVLGARFLYAPRGPWWRDDDALRALVRALRRRGFPRAPLMRADPLVIDAAPLRRLGFRPAPRQVQPRATIVVDLAREPEAILGAFAGQVRYNTRLAERKGVEVVQGGRDAVPEFWKLLAATAERKGFVERAADYYQALADILGDDAGVFLARYEGQTVAGAIVVTYGDVAYYLYGASGGDRSVKPAELVQYRAMLWAKGRGATRYDMWGIPAHPTEENPLYGVYRYKSGFGGREITYVGALDLPLIPLVQWAPGLAESLALKTKSLLRGQGFRIHDDLA